MNTLFIKTSFKNSKKDQPLPFYLFLFLFFDCETFNRPRGALCTIYRASFDTGTAGITRALRLAPSCTSEWVRPGPQPCGEWPGCGSHAAGREQAWPWAYEMEGWDARTPRGEISAHSEASQVPLQPTSLLRAQMQGGGSVKTRVIQGLTVY